MKFIIGKKLDMTQLWRDDEVMAVTRVQAGPCIVTQVKSDGKDGYDAVQLGFGIRKEKNIKKPQKGHLKSLGNIWNLREFRLNHKFDKNKDAKKLEIKRGDSVDASTFAIGDIVYVTGITKGRGFQGVVKRHGFKGTKATHGNKDQLRMPGSIGATGPAHVFKGTRMGGRMGSDQVTTGELEIIDVDFENNILIIKGSVPGARNGLLLISGSGELKVIQAEERAEKKKDAGVEKEKKDIAETRVDSPKQESSTQSMEPTKETSEKVDQSQVSQAGGQEK